jgi:hypothetical protein
MADALNDPLQRWDPKAQDLAYNNYTDRMKMELPEYTDPASSGVVYSPVEAADFVHKYADLSADSIGTAVWTPSTGKRFVITDIIISAGSNGFIKLYDGVDDSAHTIVQLALPSGGYFSHSYRKPYPSSAIDLSLYCDAYASCSGYVSVDGYEIA